SHAPLHTKSYIPSLHDALPILLDGTAFPFQVLRIFLGATMARPRDVYPLGYPRLARAFHRQRFSLSIERRTFLSRFCLLFFARSSHLSQSFLPRLFAKLPSHFRAGQSRGLR